MKKPPELFFISRGTPTYDNVDRPENLMAKSLSVTTGEAAL
jgi:hypothetical protein